MWETRRIWNKTTKPIYDDFFSKGYSVEKRLPHDKLPEQYRGIFGFMIMSKDINLGEFELTDDFYDYYYEDANSPEKVYVYSITKHNKIIKSIPNWPEIKRQYKPKKDDRYKVMWIDLSNLIENNKTI